MFAGFVALAILIALVATTLTIVSSVALTRARRAAAAGDMDAVDRHCATAFPPFLVASVLVAFALIALLMGLFSTRQLTPRQELQLLIVPILLPGLLVSTMFYTIEHYRAIAEEEAQKR